MPGKHAPESSASFLYSLARSVGGALAAVGVMVVLVVALLNRGGDEPLGSPAISPRPSSSRTTSPTPSPSTSTPTPTPTVLAPANVTVSVLNGTSRHGLASQTANEIKAEGYKVSTVGNTAAIAHSTIFYRPGHKAEALAFQQRFSQFSVVRQGGSSQDEMLRVVIGADYPSG